ncbi:MAG: putative two-component sensor protein [Pseudonocardiales bacterium]|nr:putative two-component sensor protein [Pseudonocardiales bacterium]
MGASFALLSVLLAGLGVVIGVSLFRFADRGQQVIDRWQPAVLASQALLADLLNEETSVRGFVLTGRAEFLEPFFDFGQKQARDAARLKGYLAGHQHELDQLTAFQQAAEAWRTGTAASLIRLVRASDPRAASQVDSATGKTRFDLIRTRSAALTASVTKLSNNAVETRRTAKNYFIVALAISGGLIVLAAVAVWRGLHRWVLRPVDALGGQTRDVASGDLNRFIVPTGPPEFVRLGSDVETMRRRIADELARAGAARQELIERSGELARSNDDLEQFAYVASHDLSEPLRKVANFCQLLERQYGAQLDDKARQYIDFAVDGAKRMQALINDLLAFSRVGRTTEAFARVDTAAVLARVAVELEDQISQAGAVIRYDALPAVWGDQTLLTALFVNLVGNSVKYRGTEPPVVRISAEQAPDGWLFTVADNGIGIDPQYEDRIFAIFQRLHLRDEYGGTGIGLALGRKIVEFHGGRIWLDPGATVGATFRFTLPEGPARDR